jgi:predicted nuclease of predicted toxin-antitoxin system
MNIFVDENIPLITVEELRKAGHDIMDIRGTEKEGIDDQEIWEITQQQNRLVITTDKGFSNQRDSKHSGIIIVCLRQPNRKKIHSRIMQAFSQFSKDEWNGLMVMIKDNVQSTWRSSGEDLFQ